MNLKYFRDLRGWTQAETAKKIGVTREMYNKWENGTFTPNGANMMKLIAIFAIPSSLLSSIFPSSATKYELESFD